MFTKIRQQIIRHVRNNVKRYVLLLIAFIIGVSAGAFTVNGLSTVQADELTNYFQSFIQLMDNQKVDSGELFAISLQENMKIVLVLWILGVTIIGIPFIFILVGIRGFIIGFSSGFIIKIMGLKGILFSALALLPKEIIIAPCIIALGVNGIIFSFNIIKKRSIKHMLRENLKTDFARYCVVTLFFCCFIFMGILVESYITPVFIRMIIKTVLN